MIELSGLNLGERHHEINRRVREAHRNNENFQQIKTLEEKSDVDKLFKIDLAVLNKDYNYIVEILKCGDSLYISRVLKFPSLYDEQDIINPDFLHENIFPFMSIKIKKKMLIASSVHIKEQLRIDCFYQYCVNIQLDHIAIKFLKNASPSFKDEYLENNKDIYGTINFKEFFGDSYDFIEKFLSKHKKSNNLLNSYIYEFRYLYSYSKTKYLDLFEHWVDQSNISYYNRNYRFSGEMSKDILKSHKTRVLNNINLYISMLDTKATAKYSSCEDIKKYAIALMPKNAETFWSQNFYKLYNYFLNKIPANELFFFLKELFESKYPNQLFEMNFTFYHLEYYHLMTTDQRHEWALKHIEEKKEHFGPLNDYKWYQFVKFDTSFYEIKRYIFVNSAANIRSSLIDILIKSAKTLKDLERLITYYYERHVNEQQQYKKSFVDDIINKHNVFKFDENCWTAFNKILHSLNVLTNDYFSDRYTILALVYNIIHYREVPETLETFCKFNKTSDLFKIHLKKLSTEEKELLYKFLVDYFVKKIENLLALTKTEDTNKQLKTITWSIVSIINGFKKPKEECPDRAMEIIKLHMDEFKYCGWFMEKDLTEGDLLRLLKKNKALVLEKFVNTNCKSTRYHRFTKLLKKIKTYFPNDLSKNMITFFEEQLLVCIEKNNNFDIPVIILSLFLLTNNEYKVTLMNKYAPTTPKIKYDEIDRNLLTIQEGICRFAHYSRPAVPLSNILLYIKGDYVSFCLPMFNSYLVNLPMPLSLQFIEALLDSPVSVQKHGLRLAFQSYNDDNLKELIVNVWSYTSNVSLRMIIYKALIDKIKNVKENAQLNLFEALKMFTLSLGVSDQNEVYELLVSSNLPKKFYGEYLSAVWTAVSGLPDNSGSYIDKKTRVIEHIANYIDLLDREFCKMNIIKEHIDTMLIKKCVITHDDTYNISQLYTEKWKLTAKYITHYNNEEQLKSSLELLDQIMKLCLEMWNEIYNQKYIIREFLYRFLEMVNLKTKYEYDCKQKPYINPIFDGIVVFFQRNLPINIITIWHFKLAILCRNAMGNGKYDANENDLTYNHLVNKDIAIYIAKGVVELTAEGWNSCLCKEFADLLTNNISKAVEWSNINCDKLTIAVCHNLTKSTSPDLHLLALHMLPLNSSEEIITVVDNVMALNNSNLNAFLYYKFICCDNKNRLGPRNLV